MKTVQYYALKRIGDRVAEVLVTRKDGRWEDELLVGYHADDRTALAAMRKHNEALRERASK